jgi:ABC-type multidrug transport system fused ATPase/permease subunit
LLRLGQEYFSANEERFKEVVEAFGAVKDIKAGGLESVYVKRFSKPAKTYAAKMAAAQVATQIPRFALEATAFGGMLLVVLYQMTNSGGLATALPVISLYAFAGYRLMPALQQIYIGASQLRFGKTSLDALYEDLKSLQPKPGSGTSGAVLGLEKEVRLQGVCFVYPNSARSALVDVNIVITARKVIGLVGATGSGKSTTVDVIMGLLEPTRGVLTVDGVQVGEDNWRHWQKLIGYVPQQVYLVDDTVASNIAFGVESKDIDRTTLEWAARVANLHTFVSNELPQGYETVIGERGVRLSGGQRQRIGIARALYRKPKLLIMDEATSALDNVTEQAVMDAVKNLGNSVTILMVAHRLTTVMGCDCIYLLQEGRVHGSGTYGELIASSDTFRNMASR